MALACETAAGRVLLQEQAARNCPRDLEASREEIAFPNTYP